MQYFFVTIGYTSTQKKLLRENKCIIYFSVCHNEKYSRGATRHMGLKTTCLERKVKKLSLRTFMFHCGFAFFCNTAQKVTGWLDDVRNQFEATLDFSTSYAKFTQCTRMKSLFS